jgi:hypothetical protein
MSITNIINVYDQATQADVLKGSQWYSNARLIAEHMSREYDVPIEQCVAVMSALSPRNRWENNIEDARTVLRAFKEGKGEGDVKVHTFNKNKTKAFEVLRQGNPGLVTTSNKTRAFFDNIVNPYSDKVTVDVHAYSVYNGERLSKPSISNSKYKEVSDSYKEAATQIGVKPYELQAITWVTWKRINKI